VCKTEDKNSQRFIVPEERENQRAARTLCVEQGMFMLRIGLPEGALYLPTPGKQI